MVKIILRWTVRAVVVTATVVVAARALQSLSGSSDAGILPSIGGDTWPPVPANPDRRG